MTNRIDFEAHYYFPELMDYFSTRTDYPMYDRATRTFRRSDDFTLRHPYRLTHLEESLDERIRIMEERLDRCVEATARLSAACKQWREALEDSRILEEYYQGGDWMEDYEADERGELPDDLIRGVLSEDAVYDYISDRQELAKELLRTALAALES